MSVLFKKFTEGLSSGKSSSSLSIIVDSRTCVDPHVCGETKNLLARKTYPIEKLSILAGSSNRKKPQKADEPLNTRASQIFPLLVMD